MKRLFLDVLLSCSCISLAASFEDIILERGDQAFKLSNQPVEKAVPKDEDLRTTCNLQCYEQTTVPDACYVGCGLYQDIFDVQTQKNPGQRAIVSEVSRKDCYEGCKSFSDVASRAPCASGCDYMEKLILPVQDAEVAENANNVPENGDNIEKQEEKVEDTNNVPRNGDNIEKEEEVVEDTNNVPENGDITEKRKDDIDPELNKTPTKDEDYQIFYIVGDVADVFNFLFALKGQSILRSIIGDEEQANGGWMADQMNLPDWQTIESRPEAEALYGGERSSVENLKEYLYNAKKYLDTKVDWNVLQILLLGICIGLLFPMLLELCTHKQKRGEIPATQDYFTLEKKSSYEAVLPTYEECIKCEKQPLEDVEKDAEIQKGASVESTSLI